MPAPPQPSNPKALEYQESLERRRVRAREAEQNAIPPLTMEVDQRNPRTMTEYAGLFKRAVENQEPPRMPNPAPRTTEEGVRLPEFPAPPSRGIVMQQPQAAVKPPSGPLALTMSDVLPEPALQDPTAQRGSGDRIATMQPHLANKYGIIRNGTFYPPEVVRGELSFEEYQARLRRQAQPAPMPALGAEGAEQRRQIGQELPRVDAQPKPDSPVSAGANLGMSPNRGDEEAPGRRNKEVLDRLDNFDLHTLREMVFRDILNSEEQRKIIEERLEQNGSKLSLSSLVTTGRVTQVVPIIPGQFEPEFQSIKGSEELALKRLIISEAGSLDFDNKYYYDKYSMMAIALALSKINRTVMPTHLDDHNRFSEKLFLEKLDYVLDFPFHMLASLGVHAFWFDVRVRKLFHMERIKNG